MALPELLKYLPLLVVDALRHGHEKSQLYPRSSNIVCEASLTRPQKSSCEAHLQYLSGRSSARTKLQPLDGLGDFGLPPPLALIPARRSLALPRSFRQRGVHLDPTIVQLFGVTLNFGEIARVGEGCVEGGSR